MQGEANRGKRILIVDDNTEAAEMLQMLLELHGYHVDVAASGEQGLLCAAQLQPQVICSDLTMPGMSGFEFARTIRAGETRREKFLIAVSGLAYDTAGETMHAGFDLRLVKPFSLDQVLAPIDAFFARQDGD